ncbi:MAG TPA: TonB-dependent receptor [Rhizomicrobium sp.]|jgi:iron complex outermembrane receptor protein|nr:TonB-dependent receptor [Rhizomicrobium sp.]
MRARIGTALMGAAGICLFASGALAQIETVVVTAEKRAEDPQKVPVAITALNGSELDQHGTVGFKELSAQVPSLRFGSGVTGGENVITMRGLGSQNTTPGGDSPVAYSVDGVYLQRTTSVDPEFYDINRIEALRGPQGTLYGRNSVGGSINVVTNRPDDTFAGAVDALGGDYAARIFRGWVTGPIVDDGDFQILFRLTGVSSQHDGYSDNLSSSPIANKDPNNQDYQMGRGQILVNFNSKVNLLLTASGSQDTGLLSPNTAWWEQPARYIGGVSPILPGSACDFSTQAKFDPWTFCHDAREKAYNTVTSYSGTLNWDLGGIAFTSVTGYATSNVFQSSDGDGSEAPIARGGKWLLRQHQISEEARLASQDSDTDPLKWIAGLYYFWSDNFEDFSYIDTGFNDVFPIPGIFDTFKYFNHGHTATRSYAPFGQIDYDLAKTSLGIPLTVTLGARYSADNKYGYSFLDYELPFLCPPPTHTCLTYTTPFDKSWAQWTGKAGVSYQANDNLMIYASASRGYLAGGNIVGLANIYDPESMWSYEAGLKSRFLDGRAQLNVAAYHEEIKGLQVFIQSATQSGINNVDGLTQVNGLETEFAFVPSDDWKLNATLTLTSAHYGEYFTVDNRFGVPPAGCVFGAGGNECNFKGNDLNQTPPYSLDLGLQYTFHTAWGTITPRVDTYLSGEVQFLPDNYFTSTQKAYSKTDINVSWVSTSGKYTGDIFVRNIEDNAVISNDGLQSITLGQQVLEPDNFVYYPPRTFGVRLGYRFGG